MSTAPISLPKYWPQLEGKAEPEVGTAVKLLYTGIQQHDTAIVALKKQLDAAVLAQTTINNTTTNTATAATTFPGLGVENDQRTQTAYMTQQLDNGALILLADAAAIAVTLNSGVTAPYLTFLTNFGPSIATLTPSLGLINTAASFPLPPNLMTLAVFDGTNWFASAVPVIPITIAAVATKFLTSYDATTGLFTAATPVISDVSGLSAALALLAPKASPTFTGTVTEPDAPVLTAATTTTSATAGAATALPATPAGYLTISINGTLQKIPYYAV